MLEPCLSFQRTPSIHSRPTRGPLPSKPSLVSCVFCRNHCFANHHVLYVLLCEAPPPKWHPTVRYFVPRCFSATSNSGWFRKAARMTCVRMCLLFARCFPTGRPFERLPFHMSAVLRGTFRVGAHSNASCDLEPLNACHCFEWASIRMGPM